MPDALWAQAETVLGERGINELLGLLGLYTSVCLTMVTYRMPTKGGEPDPFAAESGGAGRGDAER